ncbi:MAG: TIGR00374 family protein [Planctomycetota bacterium]|nr:MAG: TIGR00374 family protein [Planctomycetota bacterium]
MAHDPRRRSVSVRAGVHHAAHGRARDPHPGGGPPGRHHQADPAAHDHRRRHRLVHRRVRAGARCGPPLPRPGVVGRAQAARVPPRQAAHLSAVSPVPKRVRHASAIALFVAIAALIGLIAWTGVGAIAEALRTAGWRVLWLAVLYLPPLAAAACSWRLLFPPEGPRPSLAAAIYAKWIGMSANWLLPVAQVGGELIKARLIHRRGVEGNLAIASVAVDKTVQTVSQAAYTLIGLVLFVLAYADRNVVLGSLATVALLAGGAWAFYRAQQAGLFRWMATTLERVLPRTRGGGLSANAASIDAEVRASYARVRRLLFAIGLSLLHRILFASETWLALWLLGHPVGIGEALILESLGQAVRAAAFVVPGGLGAQEGSFVLLGAALGLGPELSLSFALCKRVRELVVGLPALALWQLEELRARLRARAQARIETAAEAEAVGA